MRRKLIYVVTRRNGVDYDLLRTVYDSVDAAKLMIFKRSGGQSWTLHNSHGICWTSNNGWCIDELVLEMEQDKATVAAREAAGLCIDCGLQLGSAIVGAGDGNGNKFVHELCWDIRRAKRLGVRTWSGIDASSLVRMLLEKLEGILAPRD